VAVPIEGHADGSVAQEVLDERGVRALLQEQGGAGMAQRVRCNVLRREPGSEPSR
jgi:hypothetical protein